MLIVPNEAAAFPGNYAPPLIRGILHALPLSGAIWAMMAGFFYIVS